MAAAQAARVAMETFARLFIYLLRHMWTPNILQNVVRRWRWRGGGRHRGREHRLKFDASNWNGERRMKKEKWVRVCVVLARRMLVAHALFKMVSCNLIGLVFYVSECECERMSDYVCLCVCVFEANKWKRSTKMLAYSNHSKAIICRNDDDQVSVFALVWDLWCVTRDLCVSTHDIIMYVMYDERV